MLIPFRTFTGEIPRSLPHLLPDNAAQYAMNCDFSSGDLRGMLGPGKDDITAPASAREIFSYDGSTAKMFAMPDEAEMVLGPITDDKFDRIYWTQGGYMWVTTANERDSGPYTAKPNRKSATYRVGVPAPTRKATLEADYFDLMGFPLMTAEELAQYGVDKYMADFAVARDSKDKKVPVRIQTLVYRIHPTTGETLDTVSFYDWNDVHSSGSSVKLTKAINLKGEKVPDFTENAVTPDKLRKLGYVDNGQVTLYRYEFSQYSILNYNDGGGATTQIVPGYWIRTLKDTVQARKYIDASGNEFYFNEKINLVGFSTQYLDRHGSRGPTSGNILAFKLDELGWYANAKFDAPDFSPITYTIKGGDPIFKVRMCIADHGKRTTTKVTVASKRRTTSVSVYDPETGKTASTTKTESVDAKDGTTSTTTYEFPQRWIDFFVTKGEDVASEQMWSDRYDGLFTYDDAKSSLVLTLWDKTVASVSDLRTRDYVYTYVNIWGEEGPPSPVVSITIPQSSLCRINIPAVDASTSVYAPINKIRLYRTASGSSGAEFLFHSEITLSSGAGTLITDKLKDTQLGEALSTTTYDPPLKGAKNLVALQSGVLSYSIGNKVYFCEPYMPYACNSEMSHTLNGNVVRLFPTQGGLYALTDANPHFLSGMSPETMTSDRIMLPQACVNPEAVTMLNGTVVYASQGGLVTLNGMSGSLDTSFQFFNREEWHRRYGHRLTKLNLEAYDGQLLGFFDDGSEAFMLRAEAGDLFFTRLNMPILGAAPFDESLHVLVPGRPIVSGASSTQCVRFVKFRGGETTLACKWQSKDFILPKEVNFGCFQVIGGGVVTIRVYADGVVKHTQKVTMTPAMRGQIYRLPSGFKARRWSFQVELEPNAYVSELYFAESPKEMQGV